MLPPQTIVGNYLLERELGRGGMGAVYAARHRVLGRPAAIKVLLAATADHRDRVERFFNEARAAMAIDHPGIVEIYDVGISADGRPYIAMELLAGRSLDHLLVRGPLPVRIAIDYARQIAEALAAAHAAGIIHRDLKPENVIVLDEGRRLKLVDFGIAKLAGAVNVRTATGALLGTPLYMSPEQCDGTRDVDARSDLYSLGCVLYAMLAGGPPFDAGGTGAVIGSHLHLPPPPLAPRCPAASPALVALVETLLAKSPADRLQTARAVVTALAQPGVAALSASGNVAVTADGPAPVHAHPPAWASPPTWPEATAAPTRDLVTPISPAPESSPLAPTQATRERSPAVSPPPSAPAAPSTPAAPSAPAPVAPAPAAPVVARGSRARMIALVLGSSVVTAAVVMVATRAGGPKTAPATTPADAATGSGAVVALATDAANRPPHPAAPPDAASTVVPDAAPSPPPTPRRTMTAPPRDRPRPPPPDAAPAPRPPPPDAAPSVPTTAPDAAPPPIGASGRLTFAHGEHATSTGQALIERAAKAARENPAAMVRVLGIASSSEPRPDNLALARANRVKLELVNRGVGRARIQLDVSVVDGETREVRISVQ